MVAPWRYEGAARSLILGLKLRGRRDLVVPLADAMAAEAERVGIATTALTWVPGRRSEAARRGFDHAHLLAVELGRRLGLPVTPLLARTRPAIDQTTLGARDRARNLRGAFTSSPAPRSVGLVDDLVTTGATASSCAVALEAAGAGRIEVVVPARADPTR